MNEPKPLSNLLQISLGVLGTFIGILAGLIGVWVPAFFIDYLANANRPVGAGPAGASATLLAFFFCSPIIVILGLGIRFIGNIIGRKLARNRNSNTAIYFMSEIIGPTIVGLSFGALPFILLMLYSLLTTGSLF